MPPPSLFFSQRANITSKCNQGPLSINIHYLHSQTKREVHLIHIHIVVMKVPVICFWVLIPPRRMSVCVWERSREREDKCDRDASKFVFWSDAYRSVLGCRFVACGWTHRIYTWTCGFDWLRACVFAPRECVFERQYLRAAGSPKASTLHPWPGSTGARLQSVDSAGTEERTTDTVCYFSCFYLFYISLLLFLCF